MSIFISTIIHISLILYGADNIVGDELAQLYIFNEVLVYNALITNERLCITIALIVLALSILYSTKILPLECLHGQAAICILIKLQSITDIATIS